MQMPPGSAKALKACGNIDPITQEIVALDHHVADMNSDPELQTRSSGVSWMLAQGPPALPRRTGRHPRRSGTRPARCHQLCSRCDRHARQSADP